MRVDGARAGRAGRDPDAAMRRGGGVRTRTRGRGEGEDAVLEGPRGRDGDLEAREELVPEYGPPIARVAVPARSQAVDRRPVAEC